jgi:hypothetical protein
VQFSEFLVTYLISYIQERVHTFATSCFAAINPCKPNSPSRSVCLPQNDGTRSVCLPQMMVLAIATALRVSALLLSLCRPYFSLTSPVLSCFSRLASLTAPLPRSVYKTCFSLAPALCAGSSPLSPAQCTMAVRYLNDSLRRPRSSVPDPACRPNRDHLAVSPIHLGLLSWFGRCLGPARAAPPQQGSEVHASAGGWPPGATRRAIGKKKLEL